MSVAARVALLRNPDVHNSIVALATRRTKASASQRIPSRNAAILLACARKLTIAAMDALVDPTVRQRLTDLGQEIPPPEQQTAEALAAHQKAEIEKWWPLIKAANIKAE